MVRRLFALFRNLLHRNVVEQELDEELSAALDIIIEEKMRQGLSPDEARRQALIELGGVDQTKERVRTVKAGRLLLDLYTDLRFGFRLLRQSPGFTAIAVMTLAIGIGANTAIFSAVNGILLHPLPYPDASRLITISRIRSVYYLTSSQFDELQRECPALQRVASQDGWVLRLTGEVAPKEIMSWRVSSDFFSLLGTPPLLGRPILPEDAKTGNNRIAVLSYGIWMDAFGSDPGIIGQNIFLNRIPHTVVGVMPREFGIGMWSSLNSGDSKDKMQEIWIPQESPVEKQIKDGISPWLVARLSRGATLEQAKAQLQQFSARFTPPYRHIRKEELALRASSLDASINPKFQTALLILLGAVGFVLLLACVNVSSLLVARLWKRQRELAIRKALGASRLRILRQFLAESLLLALAGAALGLLISLWGIRIVRLLAPPNAPRVDFIRVDGAALWFTMGLSLFVALLAGLAPAFQASSRQLAGALKEGLGGSFAGLKMRKPHYLRNGLVVLEVLLAVILVTGGALMARSFYKLISINTGIRGDRTLSMHVQFSDLVCKWGNEDLVVTSKKGLIGAQEVINRIQQIPGVQHAALSIGNPFIGSGSASSTSLSVFADGAAGNMLSAGQRIQLRMVSPEFFSVLGMSIAKGRGFIPKDDHAIIISETFARKFFKGDPLQGKIGFDDSSHVWMDVIGVVGDIRDQSGNETTLQYYRPLTGIGSNGIDVMVRTSSNPKPFIPAIIRAVCSVDREAPVTEIKLVDQMLADSSAPSKFQTALLGSFAALALILAVIGIYGVISYSVVQQTHEIGVRMALGARRSNILRMILKKGMMLAIIGIGIGIVGALALTRVLRNMLFEIKPTDPTTFIGVAMLLLIAALAACYIPARQVTKSDPMAALRNE